MPKQKNSAGEAQNPKNPPSGAIGPETKPPNTQDTESSREENSDPTNKNFDKDVAIWTKVVGIFTCCLFFAALLQFCAMRGQEEIMQGQLNEMQAEQRPWIYSDTPAIKDVFTNDGIVAGFTFVFTLHNSGNLPGIEIWINPRMTAIRDPSYVMGQQNSTCSGGALTANTLGFSLFPNQTSTQEFSIGIPLSEWNNPKAVVSADGGGPRMIIGRMPILIGCISYRVPGSQVPHKTNFAYAVGQKMGDDKIDAFPFPVSPDNIALAHLIVVPWISNNVTPFTAN